MATSTEVVTAVITISQATTTSGGTTYTAPADKYAEVYVQGITMSGSGSGGSVNVGGAQYVAAGSGTINFSGNNASDQYITLNPNTYPLSSTPIIINAGQTISHSAGVGDTVAYEMVVKEYNKP